MQTLQLSDNDYWLQTYFKVESTVKPAYAQTHMLVSACLVHSANPHYQVSSAPHLSLLLTCNLNKLT